MSILAMTMLMAGQVVGAADVALPLATPMGDPASWVTSEDYPSGALRMGAGGVAGFTVIVDALGNPIQCHITATSNNAELDDATCKLVIRRAHFNPPHDARGRPTAGIYRSRMKWAIPGGGPLMPTPDMPGEVMLSYVVEVDGSHSDCRIRIAVLSKPAAQVMPIPCNGARSPKGYVDAQGRPQRRRVTQTITIAVDPIP